MTYFRRVVQQRGQPPFRGANRVSACRRSAPPAAECSATEIGVIAHASGRSSARRKGKTVGDILDLDIHRRGVEQIEDDDPTACACQAQAGGFGHLATSGICRLIASAGSRASLKPAPEVRSARRRGSPEARAGLPLAVKGTTLRVRRGKGYLVGDLGSGFWAGRRGPASPGPARHIRGRRRPVLVFLMAVGACISLMAGFLSLQPNARAAAPVPRRCRQEPRLLRFSHHDAARRSGPRAILVEDRSDVLQPGPSLKWVATLASAARATRLAQQSLRVPTMEPRTVMRLSTISKIGNGKSPGGRPTTRHEATTAQHADGLRPKAGPVRTPAVTSTPAHAAHFCDVQLRHGGPGRRRVKRSGPPTQPRSQGRACPGAMRPATT